MLATDKEKEKLLGEVEDLIRSAPSVDELRDLNNMSAMRWLGRTTNAIERRIGIRPIDVSRCVTAIETGVDPWAGRRGLLRMLVEASANLRFDTLGPISTAIGKGGVYDYFDEVRKLVQTAASDVLFVDQYLDADFVTTYLPLVRNGAAIRLLTHPRNVATLVPAAALFAKQAGANVGVRTNSFHDRYLFVDRAACYQSGASFKDGGKQPTTITQITDAFAAVLQTYESLWANGKTEL